MPKKTDQRFPDFGKCMALLRNRKNVEAQEDGFYWLLRRIGEFVEPLLAELEAERDPYMRGWLLELLGKARDARAYSVFVRHLLSPNESVRWWAEWGLRELGQTREGRQVLWAAHLRQEPLPGLTNENEERYVREVLARVLGQPESPASTTQAHKARCP